ncbi:MAG: hypothetical protein IJK89_12925 [Clostridia bacterium]|nr:hypothetical protein [Clostridia bacterium]
MIGSHKYKLKKILVVALAAVVLLESVALLSGKGGGAQNVIDVTLNVSFDGMEKAVSGSIGTALSEAVAGIKAGELKQDSIKNMVTGLIHSDFVVNTVMSISYPLLYQTLVDLGMLDFATYMDLYATGPLLAGKLEGKSYTCVDKDGTRKNLTEVLNNVGEDWTYMDTKVSYEDEDGNTRETTLWNSIQWGVKDEASFYTAMNDMGEGLRGVLEVAMQGKERVINVNVLEVLLKFDKIPFNMDAATIYHAEGQSGYELGLVPLFNSLGLDEGDYPSVSEFNGYNSVGDMWKAIFGPVLTLAEKIENAPVPMLTSMLVNFADLIETGKFKEYMGHLRLDAQYNKLAAMVMGFSDGLLFNLGDALIEIIEESGLNLSGNFNDLLDSFVKVLTKKDGDLPDMDVAGLLACASEKTLSNGAKVYEADPDKVIEFMVNYLMDDRIVAAIVNATELAGTPEGEAVISGVEKSEEGLRQMVNALLPVLLKKLNAAG